MFLQTFYLMNHLLQIFADQLILIFSLKTKLINSKKNDILKLINNIIIAPKIIICIYIHLFISLKIS